MDGYPKKSNWHKRCHFLADLNYICPIKQIWTKSTMGRKNYVKSREKKTLFFRFFWQPVLWATTFPGVHPFQWPYLFPLVSISKSRKIAGFSRIVPDGVFTVRCARSKILAAARRWISAFRSSSSSITTAVFYHTFSKYRTKRVKFQNYTGVSSKRVNKKIATFDQTSILFGVELKKPDHQSPHA